MAFTVSSIQVRSLRIRHAARVVLQLAVGAAALALVSFGRATLGKRASGAAVLGRYCGRVAALAGPVAAIRVASRARRTVPAYRSATAGSQPWRRAIETGRLAGYLEALPILDKANYVDRYPVADRCRGGRLPVDGIEIDESSGSSGRPYQWVRSRAELHQVQQTLAVQAAAVLRERAHQRVVVINCFSMGAWATGSSVGSALRQLGAIKSCGPDVDKALAAIDLVGPDACYVVCGYPPFLANLLDAAAARGVDLAGLELWGFVGGEGMTEVLRGRLEKVFHRVLSAYGASDLDIGVAGETELAVALRQAAAARPELAQELFGHTGRLPMVFQYDPSTYHVETVDGELVVTVTRDLLSPRVRYAVHDAGGALDFAAAVAIARRHGVELPVSGAARIPFLYVAGRADTTLSYMGANLYPEDVDAALGSLAERHPEYGLGSFCLELADGTDGLTRPRVHVEAAEPASPAEVAAAITGWLVAHNRDWASAAEEDPSALDFVIRLAAPGTGVFEVNAARIKRRYVLH